MRYPLGGSYPWGHPDAGYLASRVQAAAQPHPEPEVTSRPATGDEAIAGASRVAARAKRSGFAVETTYAKGITLTARGKQGAVAESIGVRMRHPDGRRAIAVWLRPAGATAWKFDTAIVLPLAKVNATALAKYIEGEQ